MKKKMIIIVIILLILLIIIGGIIFITGIISDLKQENILKAELAEISELSNEEKIDKEKINQKLNNRITTGDYLKVENASKTYLADMLNNIIKITDILNSNKIENILTIENYKEDGPEFKNTKEYLANTKKELEELKKEYTNLFSEEKKMSYINKEDIDSYYIDLYKNELVGTIKKQDAVIENSIDEILKIIDSYEIIINFLEENKNSWKIQGEQIAFNSNKLSDEYLNLIEEMEKDISSNTRIEKNFGSYEIPEDWMESKTHSTANKFFYVKNGDDNKSRPNNISVNVGSNKYQKNEHEKFRMAILNQLTMQMGANSDDQLTANGSYTKNGYVLYTFNIYEKARNITTTQYYIIDDYRYVLVHETRYGTSEETNNAAKTIVDSFLWN